ncbi:GNAT family N-acetyltransferase [Pontibacter harenae]|uniref:GNAT family N-acetyltransferase n=1 Tax=Pontibacter harenae TaxID=2894083 RepID=UPI001E557A8C|nr:GNAT family protein [Pontibacter harenae]MCC9165934.1 GNAT family N-acetyltransferase [Pontibacter harenae]
MNLLYNTFLPSIESQISTENLLLRPYQEGDEGKFMQLLHENTEALTPAFVGRLGRVRVLEDARVQVRQLQTFWENRKEFDFGVWLKETESYIGDICIKNLDYKVPKAEVALYFTGLPETQQQVQEALRAIVKFAFDSLKLNKLYMRCTITNKFYGELAQATGFQNEGLFRNDFRGTDSDELLDVSYYGITRSDYEQSVEQQANINSEALA